MAARKTLKLTKRTVDSLCVSSGDTVVWDRDLPGFGIRVYSTGRKVWCAQARGPRGITKRKALGLHGEITSDEARQRATATIDRIRQGLPPEPPQAESEPTIADLAERYMESHVRVNCRPNTITNFAKALRIYIVPELGHLRLSEVDRAHVSSLHHRMRDKPWQANYVVDLLSGMLRLAEAWGMTQPGRNPCRSVRRYRLQARERFLSPEEYRALGRVLNEAEDNGTVILSAIHAIRLLMLTGCRKNEILTLKWDEVDLEAGELKLPDFKTGARTIPISLEAARVLEKIPRVEGNPHVIPGKAQGKPLSSLHQHWQVIRKRADSRRALSSVPPVAVLPIAQNYLTGLVPNVEA